MQIEKPFTLREFCEAVAIAAVVMLPLFLDFILRG